MTLKYIWWWGTRPKDMGIVDDIFIAITLRSNLTRIGNNW